MRALGLGVIGFGVVGRGFASLFLRRRDLLEEAFGRPVRVVGISDVARGNAFDERGLDLERCLRAAESGVDLGEATGAGGLPGMELASHPAVDVVIDLTPTNLSDGEPGYSHLRRALESGKHAITTNKGPIALRYGELKELACSRGLHLKFEGTVMSGTPVLEMAQRELAGSHIESVRGILNGTTNYVLTRMEEGLSYAEALREAQRLGYAEADPTADVEGFDALAKALILSHVIFGAGLRPEEVPRKGISGLSHETVEEAHSQGKRYKLLVEVSREGGSVRASVAPTLVGPEEMLYHVRGVENAISFRTETLGEVFVKGPGAGATATAQAVLHDLLSLARDLRGR